MAAHPAQSPNFVDPHAIRVLLTGFGPFFRYKESPSWLAVRELHNTVIYADTPNEPLVLNDHAIITDDMEPISPQPIHITSLEVPVNYQAVLSTVPGFHARPPVLPETTDPAYPIPPLPPNGFDFMFHVGVAGRGPLRMEKLSHKNGYRMKDDDGQYAPIVHLPKEVGLPRDPGVHSDDPSEVDRMERFLGLATSSSSTGQNVGELGNDNVEHPPNRGFGKGYENFPEELHTEIDVAKLVNHLKESGVEQVYSSMDAGHYVPDFMFYCSLAESKRMASRQEKFKERSTPSKCTPVLFMHVPPVDQPLSTAEVADAIRKIISWVCGRLNS